MKPIPFSTQMILPILNTKPNTWPPEPIDPSKPCKGMTRRVIKDGRLQYMTETGDINKGLNRPPYRLPKNFRIWHKKGYIYPEWGYRIQTEVDDDSIIPLVCPYGPPGTVLYVQETWKVDSVDDARKAMLIDFKAFPDGYRAAEFEVKFTPERYAKFRKFYRAAEFEVKFTPERYAKFRKFYQKNGWQSPYFMPREAARLFAVVKEVSVEGLQETTEEGVASEGIKPRFKVKDRFSYDIARQSFLELWNYINAKRDYPWSANPYVWAISFERTERPVTP